jgi:hypothetical protein
MKLTPMRLHALLAEMIDENPFACRALLTICEAALTREVPTAAVTCDEQPRLLINPDFVARHCCTEAHLKALVCHEFLHVLLRHTEGRGPRDPAEHLAWDAVINAIIHRTLGPDFSELMTRYYAREKGIARLLRPPTDRDRSEVARNPQAGSIDHVLAHAWSGLYRHGSLVADDIAALAHDFGQGWRLEPAAGWLGDHDRVARDAQGPEHTPQVLRVAIERALSTMNGSGIWRGTRARRVGVEACNRAVRAAETARARWRAELLTVLRRHLLPDPRAARTGDAEHSSPLPVLNAGDRRAFARALWSPLLPEALWSSRAPIARASALVYLDVSGSMTREMPEIIALLARLGRYIRRPFWAFSDVVAPAVIKDGELQTSTTGGTSMGCVLRHIETHRPRAAVVVTDGYIESLAPRAVRRIGTTRLHAIVTREGSPTALARAGVPYTQLGRMPQ